VKAREARAPVIEHDFERTVGQMGRDLGLEDEADHLAGQHRELGDARVVLEQRARHRDLTLAAALFQLPPKRFAVRENHPRAGGNRRRRERKHGKAQLRVDEARKWVVKAVALADDGEEGAVAMLLSSVDHQKLEELTIDRLRPSIWPHS
jgi:hypothetical protein